MNDQPFSLGNALTAVPEPGPERDKAIAQTWMGWHLSDRGFYTMPGKPESYNTPHNWKPSEDIAAAYQMEEVIAQKGRTATYAQALAVVFLENKIPEHEEDMWFLFAHATPEQRSKAALVAWMKGVSHPQEGE